MYKISVPIVVTNDYTFNTDDIIKNLKLLNAERVYIAIGALSFNKEKRPSVLEELKKNIIIFKNAGFEVGIWLWTFLRVDCEFAQKGILPIKGFDGKTDSFFCPTSKQFREDTAEFLKSVAILEPDIIMFDDDYRFGSLPTGFGCYCDNHLAMVSKELNEKVTIDGLAEKAFTGQPNRYRDALINSFGKSMQQFAIEMRSAIDSVNPNIRFAICSCMSLWDMDGIDSASVAKIIAGNTTPLLRLIGAPYWPAQNVIQKRLQYVIETERMESSWCKNSEIEIMAEGDVFPRPRYKTPASFLECFDTAIRASGCTDGILKYALSYTSSPDYEKGYIQRHVRNSDIYKNITRFFENKKDCGVRIYESMNKIKDQLLPSKYDPDYIQNSFFSPAAHLLSDNSIISQYTRTDTFGIAFGENARYLPSDALCNGLIIDIRSAEILMKMGIDVGIESIEGTIKADTTLIHYTEEDEWVESYYKPESLRKVKANKNADILAFCGKVGDEYPDTIYYKNDKGQKFIVFCFDAYTVDSDRFRSYSLQRLLYKYIDSLSENKLTVKCAGNPDLYILCREDENEIAIGLWNLSADCIINPKIEVYKTINNAVFLNCTGVIDNRTLIISEMSAYTFSFILCKKL